MGHQRERVCDVCDMFLKLDPVAGIQVGVKGVSVWVCESESEWAIRERECVMCVICF